MQDLGRTPSEKSIAQDLHNRIERSVSTTSSVSLFSGSSKRGELSIVTSASNADVLAKDLATKDDENIGSDIELFSEASDDGHFYEAIHDKDANTETGHESMDDEQASGIIAPPSSTVHHESQLSLSQFLSPFSTSSDNAISTEHQCVGTESTPVADVVTLSERERVQLIQLCGEGGSDGSEEEIEEEEEAIMSQPFWDKYSLSEDDAEGESMEPPWDDAIPQLDGAFDHGKSTNKKKRKRLGLVSSRRRDVRCTHGPQTDKESPDNQKVVEGGSLPLVRKRRSPSEGLHQRSLPVELSKQSPVPIELKTVHSESREVTDEEAVTFNLKERALSHTLFPLVEKLPSEVFENYSSPCLRANIGQHGGSSDDKGLLLADCMSQTSSPKLLESAEGTSTEDEDEDFRLAFSTSESENELPIKDRGTGDVEGEISDFHLVLSASESESEPEVVSKPPSLPGEHIHCSTHWRDEQPPHPPRSYTDIITPQPPPPTSSELLETAGRGLSYQGPHYSDPNHVQQPK